MNYLKPIRGPLTAACAAPGSDTWDVFREQLHRKGKARIGLGVTVESDAVVSAVFEGTYVVIKSPPVS